MVVHDGVSFVIETCSKQKLSVDEVPGRKRGHELSSRFWKISKELVPIDFLPCSRKMKDLVSLDILYVPRKGEDSTYDSWDGELVLLSVLEESKDVVADDDAGLSGENILGTHSCDCWIDLVLFWMIVRDVFLQYNVYQKDRGEGFAFVAWKREESAIWVGCVGGVKRGAAANGGLW